MGLTWTHHITIGWLLVLAAVNGTCSAFEIPARQAMMVELVGREDLHDAIALNSSGFNLARVVGPATGAAVIATAGHRVVFRAERRAAISRCWRVSRMIRLQPSGSGDDASARRRGRRCSTGLRYMRATPRDQRAHAGGDGLLRLRDSVHRPHAGGRARPAAHGRRGYGVLLACVGIGGFCGALFLAAVGRWMRRGRLLQAATLSYGVLLILFSLSRSVLVLLRASCSCGGVRDDPERRPRERTAAGIVPDALRGRLMAAYSFVVVGLSQVVGAFLAGAVARAVGVDWAIGGAAVIMLAYMRCAYSGIRN